MQLLQADLEPVIQLSRWPRPFLKWAGGKTNLLPVLRPLVPRKFDRYFEPFLGGGAMFFDLRPERSVISDVNSELIECYEVVRDHPRELMAELLRHRVNKREFYRVRALDPACLSVVSRAARLIYLNKTCFNGLYRVNRLGQFNTPFGNYRNVRLFDKDNLLMVSELLEHATLLRGHYETILLQYAQKGDFVYLDPPYLPISEYSDFKRYTPDQFYERDHEQLARVFNELDDRGCLLLLSNSFHPQVKRLYSGYRLRTASAPRFISCKGNGRGAIRELIVTNY